MGAQYFCDDADKSFLQAFKGLKRSLKASNKASSSLQLGKGKGKGDDDDDDDDDDDSIPECAKSCLSLNFTDDPTCDDYKGMIGEGGCASSCPHDVKEAGAKYFCDNGDADKSFLQAFKGLKKSLKASNKANSFLQSAKRSKKGFKALKSQRRSGREGKGEGGGGAHPCMKNCTEPTDCFSLCGAQCEEEDGEAECKKCIDDNGCHACAECMNEYEHHDEPCDKVCTESKNSNGEACYACKDECEGGFTDACKKCLGPGCQDCVMCHIASEGGDDDDDH